MSKKYKLGTRKSLLAKTQSQWVLNELKTEGIQCELVFIESEGDLNTTVPLYEIETQSPGLFTKQLEKALLNNEIDLAVHSLKDLPTTQPDGLQVSAIPKRETSKDCLISKTSLLKLNAKIGTSSLRRQAQLLQYSSQFLAVPIRGNVPTRIDKVRASELDGIIIAKAGLSRLSLDLSDLVVLDLPEDKFIPAPGQGALAIETRSDVDSILLQALMKIHDENAARETRVERAILKGLFGGCTLPLGVRCRFDGRNFNVKAFLGVQNGLTWEKFLFFDISDAEEQIVVDKMISHFKGYIHGR